MNAESTTKASLGATATVLAVALSLLWRTAGGTEAVSPTDSTLAEPARARQALLAELLNLRQIGSNTYRLGDVDLDKTRRTASFPAKVRVRKEVVEYALVAEQGKVYESLLTTACRPEDIHVACLLLGCRQVPVTGEFNQAVVVPETNAVLVEVAWETSGGRVQVPLAELVCLTSGRFDPEASAMKVERWLYNGSVMDHAGFAAQREGSLISLIRDPAAIINNPGSDRDNDHIHFPNLRLLPSEGAAVTVILRFPGKPFP